MRTHRACFVSGAGAGGLLALALAIGWTGTARADREPEPLREGGTRRSPEADRERDGERAFKAEQQLQQMVEEALAADRRISSTAVVPFVEGNHVYLVGTVGSGAEKRAAARIARGVSGVNGVSNLLAVRAGGDSRATRLAARVRRALENDSRLGGLGIHAQVVNRTVLLAGTVSSRDDVRRAVRLVRGLRGVARVENAIVLRPTESGASSSR